MVTRDERDGVVCMMRIRNEERWITRSLQRTWQVAKTVVIWDDGSADRTKDLVLEEFFAAIGWQYPTMRSKYYRGGEEGLALVFADDDAGCELHYLRSPFRPAANEMEAVSEIRAKNVLCMDGDEMLSLEAVRNFDKAVALLEGGNDMVDVPFIYLWNGEGNRRVDAIYGDRDGTRQNEVADGLPRLRFPRLFTTMRCDPYDVFEQRFAWHGHRQGRRVLGGFHCGSVPQENFHPNGGQPTRGLFPFPVIHFGYLHNEDRVKKHEWYNTIDPKNVYEGEYKHIIEVPNIHAPGPSAFAPWEDK
jgi:hypothetical protein